MHPSGLAGAARAAGLDGLAICDHNAAANAGAAVRAGRRAGVTVLAGMEIATEEEVHVVALLPDVDAATRLERRVHAALEGWNDEAVFGPQVIVDEDGQVTGFEARRLIGATSWSLEATVAGVHAEGGLAIAAHVDRERFGLIGQLGFVPPGLGLDALEVSPCTLLAEARVRFADTGLPVVTASDAHAPSEVGRAVTFWRLDRPSVRELGLALGGRDGRALLGGGRPMDELALHILDLARNAAEAGARQVEIDVVEDRAGDRLLIEVRDDGRGMAPERLARATDPFYTTRSTRRVGLGLALLEAAARAAGGDVTLESQQGAGTRVRATFRHSHVDRAPLGDLETTLLVLVAGHPALNVRFRHAVDGGEYEVRFDELRAALADRTLASSEGLARVRAAVRAGETRLGVAAAAR